MSVGNVKALLTGAFLSLFSPSWTTLGANPSQGDGEVLIVTVSAVEIIREVSPDEVPFHGVTRGSDRTTLAFEVSGQMERRPVQVGDRVSKGQLIASLDQETYRLALEEAQAQLVALEAQLAQAKRNENRVQALLNEAAATKEELEQLTAGRESYEARVKALKTSIANLRRRLADTQLKAPFAGTVTRVFREPGEFLGTGVPVVSLSNATQVEVEIEIPETFLPGLALGDSLKAKLPFSGGELRRVEITSLSQHGQDRGALFPVILSFKSEPDLMPGQSVTVWFPKRWPHAVQIPISAIVNPGGQQARVFVVREGRAKRLNVEMVTIRGTKALVRGPFQDADKVIYRGHHRLLDGDPIRLGAANP